MTFSGWTVWGGRRQRRRQRSDVNLCCSGFKAAASLVVVIFMACGVTCVCTCGGFVDETRQPNESDGL